VSTLIVGLSTRAIAESAARSGDQIITLDYFGDRDQKQLVENYSLARDFHLGFSAQALLQASHEVEYDRVIYISNLENHPQVVEELSRGRVLLGNPPPVLRKARDWRRLRTLCAEDGLPVPTTLLPGEEVDAHRSGDWLVKPIRSGGGHGIRFWSGEPLDEEHLLQRFVAGRPASAAFVADGERSVLLGLTEQLIGRAELGAKGFTWCGNLLPLALPVAERVAILAAVQSIADRLTRHLGLKGVNGIDLIMADGQRPFLVELNPRYTASMELVEQAYGLNIFSLHLAALRDHLPRFSLTEHLDGPCYGKGIVFARDGVSIPETEDWRERGRRDIPFPGEQIQAGHPVCTVLAHGDDRETCWEDLLTRVEWVRRDIGDQAGGAR
jgi:predicted ATP-grasp superfamily ATP-dependent carboligase